MRFIYSICSNYNIVRSSHEHFKQNLLHWCTIIAPSSSFWHGEISLSNFDHFLNVENVVVVIHTIRNVSFLHCLLYHPAHGRIKIHNWYMRMIIHHNDGLHICSISLIWHHEKSNITTDFFRSLTGTCKIRLHRFQPRIAFIYRISTAYLDCTIHRIIGRVGKKVILNFICHHTHVRGTRIKIRHVVASVSATPAKVDIVGPQGWTHILIPNTCFFCLFANLFRRIWKKGPHNIIIYNL